jgi:hypothetical protein
MFPFFKNFIPPEDRIQIEPPTPNPIVEPQPVDGDRPDWSDEPATGSNLNALNGATGAGKLPEKSTEAPESDESVVVSPGEKTQLVDGNVEAPAVPQGPVGWTHQKLGGPNSGEILISADSANAPPVAAVVSEESGDANRDAEDRFLTGPPDFSKQKGQQAQPVAELKRQPEMDLQRPIPIDTSIDFPAVKFPTNDTPTSTEQQHPSADHPVVGVGAVQQDQEGPKPSNPVFFQVDDPVEQQQLPIRTVA